MAQPRKILLADPDLESVRALSRALRERGHEVHYAPDGSRALELAILRHPDLALFDEACALVDARTFVRILRSNPRTEEIPVVLTGRAVDPERLQGVRDGYLQKPFNQDEVLSLIEQLFRRSASANDLQGEGRELEGNLGQLGVADLLQMLSMNRRTGRLNLARGTESGEIHVGEGRPLNAAVGSVDGEKALFRLLCWDEGTFAFVPGPATFRVRIQRGMDEALLEGMRHKDESARLRDLLPARGVRLQAAPGGGPRDDLPQEAAAVLGLLRQPRTVDELFDASLGTDLEAGQALQTLLSLGVVRALAEDAHPPVPLLEPAEVHALRSRLPRGRSGAGRVSAKVLVIGPDAATLGRLRDELPGFVSKVPAEPLESAQLGFGTLGELPVSDTLWVDFFALPTSDAARPLWGPFAGGALGALVVDPEARSLATFLSEQARLPLVVLGPEVPEALRRLAPSPVAKGDAWEATRALLLQALSAHGSDAL